MAKPFKINLPEEKRFIQQSLFTSEKSKGPSPWPELGGRVGVERIIESDDCNIGLDLEFNRKGVPSILGLATVKEAAACTWDLNLVRSLLHSPDRKLVGHAVISADKPVLDGALKKETPLSTWEDSMITHYLCNSNFAAAPGKGEDDDDATALGLMNLWTMTSLYTDVPQWKSCRGYQDCDGPCPTHRVFDYCAMDAWAGLVAYNEMQEEMKRKKIPYTFYRELVELADIAYKMQVQGVRVSKDRIKRIQQELDVRKDGLFPYDIEGRKKVYKNFNPKSAPQIIDYFAGKGIVLRTSDINEITKALEKAARKLGVFSIEALIHRLPAIQPESIKGLDLVAVEALLKLYQYKESGKGLKSWFDEKYIERDSTVHPRWIVTGTSTGRWSSSKPNFTNIPKEDDIRSIIVAQEGCRIIKCDFSQMELRICLYEAGYDVCGLSGDAFSDLVIRSDGKFDRAAEIAGRSPRYIAKSVSHAADYMEGVQVLMPEELIKSSIQKEVEYGSRVLFRDWDYAGGLVSFTGANLAERLFGNKSQENRKKALQIQELYFQAFDGIRRWQKEIGQRIENRGYIQSRTGRYLELMGTPEENLKTACAFIGQGQGSDFVQEKILDYWRGNKLLWTMFVHDEAVFDYIPLEWNNKKIKDFLEPFNTESKRFPGFVCPSKVKAGPSWGETVDVTL